MKRHIITPAFHIAIYTRYSKKASLISHRCETCDMRTREYVEHVVSITAETHSAFRHEAEVVWYQHHMCHNKTCITKECLRSRLNNIHSEIRNAAELLLREKFQEVGVSSDVAHLHQLAKVLASPSSPSA
ncbi:MAG: hypothetical protein G01um101470_785 [Parcubacteria group bacterium Gr01-1014_70]|nr:MAG: hypothetical protein G01um101470_785 [Parcubacteria group bacterium Gr01-1014_70]